MKRIKRKIPVQNRKRFKWWVKNNYIFLIIVGVICLIAASILIFEVYNFERTRNMEVLLQKTRREMHWERGITEQDVEILKKRYPNTNWDNIHDRQRTLSGQKYLREERGRARAEQKLR